MKNFVQNPDQKIVITFDNNETLARIYENNKVIAKGVAHCNPEDEFDIVLGSTLAMTRAVEALTPKTNTQDEWVVVKRDPKPGDYIRLTKKEYPFDEVGDILKVHCVGLSRTDWANVLIDEHPKCKKYIKKEANGNWPFATWCYRSDEFEIIEPAPKHPKKPEYRKITRLPKEGDYAKIIRSFYDFDDPDLFLPIRGVVSLDDQIIGFHVLNKDHPGAMKYDREHPPVEWSPDQEWHYNCSLNTIEFYEKV